MAVTTRRHMMRFEWFLRRSRQTDAAVTHLTALEATAVRCKAWLDLRLNTAAALISFLVAACAGLWDGDGEVLLGVF